MQALLLLLGIGLSTHRAGRAHSKKLIAAPLLILLVLAGILFIRGGDGARGLPPGYTGAAYSLLYGYERSTDVVAPRGPVSLPLVRPLNGDGDIVLLVDESISGQYLDINSDRGVYSGLKAPGKGVAVHNFGLAVSIAHCSAAVNYTLRHGGTRDDYVRINGTMPSIWSYARKAGLETVYIDVPRTDRIFNNMMDEAEAKDIDRWIQFDDVPIQRRDHAAADALAGLLNDGKRQFIYVQKIGAHFPIHDKYPDAYMRYRSAQGGRDGALCLQLSVQRSPRPSAELENHRSRPDRLVARRRFCPCARRQARAGGRRAFALSPPRCHRHQITYSQSASARSIQPP